MTVLTIRADSAVERALEYLLAEREGETRSDVVRAAILELERATRRARLREESARLRDDPEFQAEVRAVQAEMEHLRAW
jgi:predicted transcriptional regulator